MQSMRSRYFENYEKVQTPAKNRRGFKTEYRYKGDWYAWDLSDQGLKTEKVVFASAELAGIAVFLVSASRHTEFNSLRLAAGFAALSVIPYIAELWGVIRFLTVKQPMTIPDYNGIRNCIQIGTVVRAILIAAAVFTGAGLLTAGAKMNMTNLPVMAGHAISGALSLFVFRRYNRLNYCIFRNKDGKIGTEK